MSDIIENYISKTAEEAMPAGYALQVAHSCNFPACPACFRIHRLRHVPDATQLVCECTTTFEVHNDQLHPGWFYTGAQVLIEHIGDRS